MGVIGFIIKGILDSKLMSLNVFKIGNIVIDLYIDDELFMYFLVRLLIWVGNIFVSNMFELKFFWYNNFKLLGYYKDYF